MKATSDTIGVVVARFQVPQLHEGHQHLINYALFRHTKVIIVVCSSPFPTPRNPLSFAARKVMVEKQYGDLIIEHLHDQRSDLQWSLTLDEIIRKHGKRAVLYGSRRSFIPHYRGAFPTKEVPRLGEHNGTAIRSDLATREIDSIEFRSGVIHAWSSRLPVTRPTVDVAIWRPETRSVLLGAKSTDGKKLRFIGGLVDPEDLSLEDAAKREAAEETGFIELDGYTYIGSRKVNDWRYSGSGEYAVTSLFCAQYIFGSPKASDDIIHLEWVPIEKMLSRLTKEHRPLGAMFLTWLAQRDRAAKFEIKRS